jgi:polygalacturonase
MQKAGFPRRGFLAAGVAMAALPARAQENAGRGAVVNILAYGARGDGKTMATGSLQKAVAACVVAGGGTVYVPPGVYLTAPIELASNVVLHLEAGAVLLGSPNLEDYPMEKDAVSGESERAGLVTVRDAENAAIVGMGAIDGNATPFHQQGTAKPGRDYDKKYTRQKEKFMSPEFGAEQGPWIHAERPGNLVRFIGCRNVTLRGVTVRNSPTWTVQFYRCDGVLVTGVYIHSRGSDCRVPNDDGIDLKECKRVRISDSNIDTGDDCIAIFGSQRVTVTNCTLTARSSGVRVGFEDGETRDCVFSNLSIDSNCGLKINVRGPGSVENVLFDCIVMRNRLFTGHWWGKAEPIHVSAQQGGGPGRRLGRIRNIRFLNILAESEAGIVVCGCPESVIEGLVLANIRLRILSGPLQRSYGGNFDFRSTTDFSTALFAHEIPGLYFRYVDDLTVDGFDLAWEKGLPDFYTWAVMGEDFRQVEIKNFRGRSANAPEPFHLERGQLSGVTGAAATPR